MLKGQSQDNRVYYFRTMHSTLEILHKGKYLLSKMKLRKLLVVSYNLAFSLILLLHTHSIVYNISKAVIEKDRKQLQLEYTILF